MLIIALAVIFLAPKKAGLINRRVLMAGDINVYFVTPVTSHAPLHLQKSWHKGDKEKSRCAICHRTG